MRKKIDLTGKRFGRLVVVREDSQRTNRGQVKWICQCDCGNIVSVRGGDLRNGHTQSCGCIYKGKERGKKDLVGQRFGRLTVIQEDSERDKYGRMKWICRCDCGNVVSVAGRSLQSGNTKSCGCLNRERMEKMRKGHKYDLTGQRFGRLTVIKRDPEKDKSGSIKWICQCDCGNVISVRWDSLMRGHTQSCGCICKEKGRGKKDLLGQRFGRLTVIWEEPERNKNNEIRWLCRCDCGNVVSVSGVALRNGNTKSCGCLPKDLVKRDVVDGTKVSIITPNRKLNSNNTSGKRGVYWDKARQDWIAKIGFKNHLYFLGRSNDFAEACRMRDEAEEHFYGDFLKWYAEAYPEEWERLNKKEVKHTMRKVFLESNGYNMLGFIFDDGMVAFDCETIDQALIEDCRDIEICKTAEEAITKCNAQVIEFNEDEWESVTEITQKWTRYEYRDKGGVGSFKVYDTKEEALKDAGEEWRNLMQSDKESYINDAAGSFYVGLFNACIDEDGDWLIGADPIEVAMNYLEG